MENTVNISAEKILTFATELFTTAGVVEQDAAWWAHTLVNSNLRGMDSHGILRAPAYFERILCGAINSKPSMTVTQLAPAITVVDGDGAAGCVAAKCGMEHAIDNAKKNGIGFAGVTNSNHFGAAAPYAQMALDENMIAIVMSNVPPLMTAPGAKAKLVGNNPIAIGIPTYNEFPFLLDMALSVVAEGKLRFSAAKGMKIPASWAVDSDGVPTDDPTVALKGFLLPVGGHKGLGLAYAVDIISGLMTSGVFADKIKSMYRNPTESGEIGHTMIAIDLMRFVSQEEMQERMKYYHDYILAAPMVEGSTLLCFPGEIEQKNEIVRRETGIPVPLVTIDQLNTLKEQYQMTASL